MSVHIKIGLISLLTLLATIFVMFFLVQPMQIERESEAFYQDIKQEFSSNEDEVISFFNEVEYGLDLLLENDLLYVNDTSIYQSYTNMWEEGITYNPGPEELQITEELNFYKNSKNFAQHVYVGFKSGSFIMDEQIFTNVGPGESEDYDPRTRVWYQDALNHPGEIIFTNIYESLDATQTSDDVNYYSTLAKTFSSNDGTILGVIAMDIEISTFLAGFEMPSYLDYGRHGIIQGDNVILYHSESSESTESFDVQLLSDAFPNIDLQDNPSESYYFSVQMIDGVESNVFVHQMDGINITFIQVIPVSVILGLITEQVRPIINIFAGMFVFMFVVIYATGTIIILIPLQKIKITSDGILKNNDYSVRFDEHKKDEMGSLSKSFNKILNEVESKTKSMEERIKELQSLHAISRLVNQSNDIEEVLMEVCLSIKNAMQFEEDARVRITYQGKIYETDSFVDTEWFISEKIISEGKELGKIEVFYIDEKPIEYHGPFYKEEANLLKSIVQTISTVIASENYKDNLKEMSDGFEQQVVERTKELQDMAEELKTLNIFNEYALDLSKSAYWRINLDEPDVYISNPRTIRMLGEEFNDDFKYSIKAHEDRISAVDPEIARELMTALPKAIERGEKTYHITFPYKRPIDKEVVWIKMVGVIEYKNSKPISVFGINQDITSQKLDEDNLKLAKEELEKSRENLQRIFQSSLDAIMVVDAKDGTYLSVNKAAREMYKIPDDADLSSFTSLDFSPKFQEDGRLSAVVAQENTRKTYENKGYKVEWIAKRLDQTLFPTHLSLSTVTYQNKDAILVISRDITDIKRTERQEVQTSRLMSNLIHGKSLEEKLHTIADSLQDIFNVEFARIWMVSEGKVTKDCVHLIDKIEDKEFCHSNDCFSMLTSASSPEHLNNQFITLGRKTIGHILIGDEEPFMTNHLRDDERISKSNTLDDLSLKSYAVQLIYYPNGDIAGVIDIFGTSILTNSDYDRLTSLCNVTGQVIMAENAQSELKETREKIQEVYDKSDMALELANAGYWTIYYDDPEYYVSSKKTCDILGEDYRDDFKFNLATEWMDRLIAGDPETAAEAGRLYDLAVKGDIPVYNVDYKYKRPKDGKVIWTRAIGTIIRNEDGSPKLMNGVTVDITDQIAAEEALLAAKQEAEEATKSKSDFLANMSHEIRTPMNAIIGLSRLLETTNLTSKQRDYVVKTNRAANNLLGIINDILDFSKIEAGKMTIEKAAFCLDEVLDNISSVIGVKAFDKEIELILSKNYDLNTKVIGDSLRLSQILINLINNAIKFTSEGQVLIKVDQVNKTKKSTKLKFSVIDSGIGMTEEQLGRLFEAFSQADTSTTRKYGGTGLGLSISKNLVEQMGGSISVESEYGKGSTFTFELTFALGEESEGHHLIIPDSIKSIKALVVDDNEAARDVLKAYLSEFGIQTFEAKDGYSALDMIDETYDLVFLDWKMPGLNGIETWIEIKNKLKVYPQVVMVTAYGKSDVVEAANDVDIHHVLMKPVSESTIYDAIMDVFGIESDHQTESINQLKIDGLDNIRGAKILVAEDNEINQQVAKETLENEGFIVDIANNGKIACDMFVENKDYDLIFMDLQMPIMSGYEASKWLRENGYKEVPIIALSADAMSGVEDKVSNSGMNGFVSKPIDVNELFTALVKYIKSKERLDSKTLKPKKQTNKLDLSNQLSRFDVKNALTRVANNQKVYINILHKYVDNYSDFVSALKVNITDNERISRDLHSLKGVSANIGAIETNKLVIQLEKDFKQGKQITRTKAYKLLEQSLKEDITSIMNMRTNNDDLSSRILADKELDEYLIRLTKQIEDFDTEAKETILQLEDTLHHLKIKNIDKLKSLLDNYDFDQALMVLNNILEKIKGDAS